MKKVSFFVFGAAAAFASVACSVETMTPSTSADTRVPMEFSAGISDDGTADSKTSINSNLNVLWSEGDAISVFDGTYNNKFDLTSGADSKSGSFSGSANEVSEYFALYPYSASALYANNTITASLPSQQYSTVDGSFETMLYPSVAKTSGTSMIFRNIAGLVRVTVNNLPDGTEVRSIQLSASESLTGAYTVDTSGDDFEAVRSGSESSGAVLTAKDGGNLAAGPYHIVVLPGEYTDFKVTVVLSDNSYVTMSGPASITANGGLDIAIDASNATANSQGLYGLFMAGEDIYIGGTAYNKSQFEESDIVFRSTTANGAIYNGSASYGDGKIIFMAGGGTAELGNVGDIIVIGNNPDNKPTLTKNTSFNLFTNAETGNARLILANVNLDLASITTTNNYSFAVSGTTAHFEELIFDNCDITVQDQKFIVNVQTTGTALDKFVMSNCKVEFTSGDTRKWILSTATNETSIQEVIFNNNTFYCPDGLVTGFRLINSQSNTTTNLTSVENLTVSNNTFVNIGYTNSGLVTARTYGPTTVSKNLVFFNQTLPITDQKTQTTTLNFIRSFTEDNSGYPSTTYCIDNIVYQGTNTANFYTMAYRSFVPTSGINENPDVIEVNPFDGGTFTIETGDFTPTAEYASYGAQR